MSKIEAGQQDVGQPLGPQPPADSLFGGVSPAAQSKHGQVFQHGAYADAQHLRHVLFTASQQEVGIALQVPQGRRIDRDRTGNKVLDLGRQGGQLRPVKADHVPGNPVLLTPFEGDGIAPDQHLAGIDDAVAPAMAHPDRPRRPVEAQVEIVVLVGGRLRGGADIVAGRRLDMRDDHLVEPGDIRPRLERPAGDRRDIAGAHFVDPQLLPALDPGLVAEMGRQAAGRNSFSSHPAKPALRETHLAVRGKVRKPVPPVDAGKCPWFRSSVRTERSRGQAPGAGSPYRCRQVQKPALFRPGSPMRECSMITARRLSLSLAVCVASASLFSTQPAMAADAWNAKTTGPALSVEEQQKQQMDSMDKLVQMILQILKDMKDAQANSATSIKRG
jgi:hypothetical protein